MMLRVFHMNNAIHLGNKLQDTSVQTKEYYCKRAIQYKKTGEPIMLTGVLLFDIKRMEQRLYQEAASLHLPAQHE